MKELFPGVFIIDSAKKEFGTLNAVPGKSVYGEHRFTIDGREYRAWSPFKSKACAAFKKGLKNFPIKPGSKLLYLGIADGTTASHLSEVVGKNGMIIGVDIAHKPFEKLLMLCESRENIIPVLSDANKPENYADYVKEAGGADVIYQDLAQKTQAEILIKNAKLFLKKDGFVMYAVKSRSIDVTEKPDVIFDEELEKLRKAGFEIIEIKKLDPFEKDHAMIVACFKK